MANGVMDLHAGSSQVNLNLIDLTPRSTIAKSSFFANLISNYAKWIRRTSAVNNSSPILLHAIPVMRTATPSEIVKSRRQLSK